MKLHLLENLIGSFIEERVNSDDPSWYYPHSLVDHFNRVWKDPAGEDIKTRYDRALRSEISQRWWKRDNYRPKEIMLMLIDADPELAEIAFKDLANDSATLDGRLSRFNYYAEDLLQMHRQRHRRATETYHHQDARMLSLYLAGIFPEKYALYPGLDTFQNFCKKVGSPDIPVVDDLVRYNKVASIIFKFLQKHVRYDDLLSRRADGWHKIKCIPYQITYEVINLNDPENHIR